MERIIIAESGNSIIYHWSTNSPKIDLMFKTVVNDREYEFNVSGFERGEERMDWLVGVLDGIITRIAGDVGQDTRKEIGESFKSFMAVMNINLDGK